MSYENDTSGLISIKFKAYQPVFDDQSDAARALRVFTIVD